jgi:predicted GIY-YIG superfamily endonuclease
MGKEHMNYKRNQTYDTQQNELDSLKKGEAIKLDIEEYLANCARCGSLRIRKRIIDLPVYKETILFRNVLVTYCADCRNYEIPRQSINELIDRFKIIGVLDLDENIFLTAINEGLTSYGRRWANVFNRRKVVSIYFPTKYGVPAKAQVSLSGSDQLYRVLRSLSSEDIRNKLSIHYYEDLDREAKKQHRSISQFIKYVLNKKLLRNVSSASMTGEKKQENIVDTKEVIKSETGDCSYNIMDNQINLQGWKTNKTNKRDTYKYNIKVDNKIVHSGITNDLERREQEHKQRWPKGRIVKVGRVTTEEAARRWEERRRKALSPRRKK